MIHLLISLGKEVNKCKYISFKKLKHNLSSIYKFLTELLVLLIIILGGWNRIFVFDYSRKHSIRITFIH